MRATFTRSRDAMECPKCHFDHPQQVDECLKCGVIFSKYVAFQEAVEAVRPVVPERSPEEVVAAERQAHHEWLCRVFALPGALLFGWLANHVMPMLTAFLSMWTHEFGHAIAAWFCGYTAFPTAWFCVISDERSRWISILMGVALMVGGYFAFRLERWFWVAACAVVLLLVTAGNLQTDFHSRLLFTFWGDGGAYALSTLLMMTFYARPNSPLTRNQVRWGLLLIGAMAFWSVYTRWAGGFENIANALADTDERGPSDVLQLTTMYGWSIYTLIHHYWDLGRACLLALAAAYAAGIVQAKRVEATLGAEVKQAKAAGV